MSISTTCYISPPEKGSTLKKGSTLEGKNLLTKGANSFLLEQTPFQKGDKTILTGVTSLESVLLFFVLRFYGLVNPMGSCQARSIYMFTGQA